MKYLIKPKFNNCVLVETQWGHKKDKSKSATEICWYRFQKYEVELADGADIDQLKQSETINLRTVESEIANSLANVQKNNADVEIGSYPFFHAGKLGVSIVIRSENEKKINTCQDQILEFVKEKKIEIVNRD